MFDEISKIHHLWFKVGKYLSNWYYELITKPTIKQVNGKLEIGNTKRRYKELKFEKVVGYKAMVRMDHFCQKYPDVIPVRCDDSIHAGSTIYLIPHESNKEYWGTSFLYIPQLGDRNLLFLYPERLKDLIAALTQLDKKYEDKRRRDNNEETEERIHPD